MKRRPWSSRDAKKSRTGVGLRNILKSGEKSESSMDADRTIQVLEAETRKLREQLQEKDELIELLKYKLKSGGKELDPTASSIQVMQRRHALSGTAWHIDKSGPVPARTGQYSVSRRLSYYTSTAISKFSSEPVDFLANRVIQMFRNPEDSIDYMQSQRFAEDMMTLSTRVSAIFEEELRCLFLQSPVYVFGDIHGNLEDLNFFCDNVWNLGMRLTAGKFLFLGDYVDRGLSGLETTAYLFALKCLYPKKIFMLRGNHETRDVNGWEGHYGERSFLVQCKQRFGRDSGERVWEMINQAYDRLPLSAVIDHDIFCVHGGLPRPVEGFTSRLEAIMAVPVIAGVNPPNEFETAETHQVASDCLWSDPASEEQEDELDDAGFGESLRGGGAVCFGRKAVLEFLKETDLSFVVRAHEAHGEGVLLSKGAKVMTVFSTSKDHGQGEEAMAGCLLVDEDRIEIITRSVRYPPKYVFPRNSKKVSQMSEETRERWLRLGLITHELTYEDAADDDYDDDDDDDLEGENIEL